MMGWHVAPSGRRRVGCTPGFPPVGLPAWLRAPRPAERRRYRAPSEHGDGRRARKDRGPDGAWGPNAQMLGPSGRATGPRLPRRRGLRDRRAFHPGGPERPVAAARDLIDQGADILFTAGGMAAHAAQAATARIPIVFAGADNPVEQGLVQSIRRPGGNITGVIDLENELAGKRLEIFRRSYRA